MKAVVFSLILFLALSCETAGEYRERLKKVACECSVSNNLGQEERVYPDPNLINTFTKVKRDQLLQLEQATIDSISACMREKKLTSKGIDRFWTDYDIYKVGDECQTEQFRKFYRYVYELRHGSF